MNNEIAKKLKPCRGELLSVLSKAIDDSMLLEIAKGDYGSDVKLHLKALRDIRNNSVIPAPIEWHPKEVLELIRWSQPNDPNWKPGSTGSRGHIMRAFSCVALLMAAPEEENKDSFEGENDTLAQLIDSIEFLGEPYEKLIVGFLVWRLQTIDHLNEERLFFILAILYFIFKLHYKLTSGEILEIINTLFEQEKTIRESGFSRNDNKWLLGLTFFDQRHAVWLSLAEKLFLLSESIPDKKVKNRIIDVCEHLLA